MTTPSATCADRERQERRKTSESDGDRRDSSHSVRSDRADQDDEGEIAMQVIEAADRCQRHIARDARIDARRRCAP